MGSKHRCLEYGSYGTKALPPLAESLANALLDIRADHRRLPVRSPIRYQIRQRRRPHRTNHRAPRSISQITMLIRQMVTRNFQPQGRVTQHSQTTTLGAPRRATREISSPSRGCKGDWRLPSADAGAYTREASQRGWHDWPFFHERDDWYGRHSSKYPSGQQRRRYRGLGT